MKHIQDKLKEFDLLEYVGHNLKVEWVQKALEDIEKEARQQGYNRGMRKGIGFTKDEVYQKGLEASHPTKDGYCCACDYDMAVMEEKINTEANKRLDGLQKVWDSLDIGAIPDMEQYSKGWNECRKASYKRFVKTLEVYKQQEKGEHE